MWNIDRVQSREKNRPVQPKSIDFTWGVDWLICLISYLWKCKTGNFLYQGISKHYSNIIKVWKRNNMQTIEGNNDFSRSAQIIWSPRWLTVTQQVKKEPKMIVQSANSAFTAFQKDNENENSVENHWKYSKIWRKFGLEIVSPFVWVCVGKSLLLTS